MIVELRGRVGHVDWEEQLAVIDVQGVGYGVRAPKSTLDRLPDTGEEVRVYTHLHVREDALELFGFGTRAERELFELLLTVSKVGPRLALSVLSSFPVQDIRRAVQLNDVSLLTEVPGIGRKTAQRLILELRDKLGSLPSFDAVLPGEGTMPVRSGGARVGAEEGLVALGYSRQEATAAVDRAVSELEAGATVEDILRVSLRRLGASKSAD